MRPRAVTDMAVVASILAFCAVSVMCAAFRLGGIASALHYVYRRRVENCAIVLYLISLIIGAVDVGFILMSGFRR